MPSLDSCHWSSSVFMFSFTVWVRGGARRRAGGLGLELQLFPAGFLRPPSPLLLFYEKFLHLRLSSTCDASFGMLLRIQAPLKQLFRHWVFFRFILSVADSPGCIVTSFLHNSSKPHPAAIFCRAEPVGISVIKHLHRKIFAVCFVKSKAIGVLNLQIYPRCIQIQKFLWLLRMKVDDFVSWTRWRRVTEHGVTCAFPQCAEQVLGRGNDMPGSKSIQPLPLKSELAVIAAFSMMLTIVMKSTWR